jgi:nucleoid DNA-binding protein
MTKNKMANEFSKSVSSKKSSRALVTQFAEEISASLKWAA